MNKWMGVVLLLAGQFASADTSKSDRYGIVVLDSHELVSKVSLVSLSGNSPEPALRALHTASHSKEPLALDDEVKDSNVWMFGTPIAKTRVHTAGGDLALRIEFVGLGGTDNRERLDDVVKPAHLVVLMLKGDESRETVEKAIAAIKPHLRADRAEQLCLWLEHESAVAYPAPVIGIGKKSGPSGLLTAIVGTIRSGQLPGDSPKK